MFSCRLRSYDKSQTTFARSASRPPWRPGTAGCRQPGLLWRHWPAWRTGRRQTGQAPQRRKVQRFSWNFSRMKDEVYRPQTDHPSTVNTSTGGVGLRQWTTLGVETLCKAAPAQKGLIFDCGKIAAFQAPNKSLNLHHGAEFSKLPSCTKRIAAAFHALGAPESCRSIASRSASNAPDRNSPHQRPC